jgi:hypothetical protein
VKSQTRTPKQDKEKEDEEGEEKVKLLVLPFFGGRERRGRGYWLLFLFFYPFVSFPVRGPSCAD